jgi:predicted ATPase
MIKLLELINFGGYRSLQLDLAPLTVIIGSNAYGKSTLLHAISVLMAGVDVAARAAPTDDSSNILIHGEPLDAIASVSGDWLELFTRTDAFLADYLEVQGIFDGPSYISKGRLTARVESGGQPEVAVELELRISRALPSLAARGASAALINHVSTLRLDETYLSDEELKLASRPGSQAVVVRNRLIRLDEVAIERLNRTLRNLANAEIVARTTFPEGQAGAPLEIHFRRDGSTFEIRSANHALVNALALLSEVETQLGHPTETGERLLLLDEPELHLHPLAQAAMAEHLAEVSRVAGAQIVSTTHSDHIVRRLWSHADSAIITIERQFTRLRRLYSQKDLLKALGQTHDLTPFAAINFLTSRRILFIEGETDETIVQRCAFAYLGSSPEQLARFETWTRVQLDGASNAPAANLVERLVSSPLLPRLKRNEALVVAIVLDRDYDKEPGHRIQSGSQVERIEHIWSRHSIESLFIDIDILDSLLLAALGAHAPTNMRDRIRAAIAAADTDENLREGAEDELADVLRRTRQFIGKAAQVEARQRVRAKPEIWQRGKDRAEFVLRHVRKTLPSSLQNKVRASISKILEFIPTEKLGQVKLPSEIITLLDELVARAMA